MKKKLMIILACLLIATGIGVIMEISNHKKQIDANTIGIEILQTDKSRYSPEDAVSLTYKISNVTTDKINKIKLYLKVTQLENTIETKELQEISLAAGEELTKKLEWTVPDSDYTGYLLEIGSVDSKGSMVVSDTIGVDVSSTWLKFPRYGYLCDFGTDVEEEEKIAELNQYHINALEYYDWQYLHHQPLADGITKENPGEWNDWSGRKISGQTITDYIKAAKKRNMANMAYNMIYAGTDSFFTDEEGNPTKANDWKLYFAEDNEKGKGNFNFHMGTSPSGNGNLYFVNPLNKEWQKHIFQEEQKVFQVFDFDGWHGDTVGDWGKMVTADGKPLGYKEDGSPIYFVKDTYQEFLNAAKEALGDKYLTFNPVGAQGIQNANRSNVDVLYTEFWPWDTDREGKTYDTYASLVREIERSNEDSKTTSIDGKGKSLVVKAYINYDKTNGYMNGPGVLLCDAAVYAAGGSRLELGNGNRMLHVEYYPDDDILMDEKLARSMKNMSDFIVAYENLLRDGQKTTEHMVHVKGYQSGKEGTSDSIWTYTRADDEYEILHLINLLGTDNTWRDERGKKAKPLQVNNLQITYYTDRPVSKVFMASPDLNKGRSEEIKFKRMTDENGTCIKFDIPTLEYWDMIYMK